MAKEAASSQEEITLMTVKHWNTGPAAARFRIQAASVKLKKNKSKAASIKLGGPAQSQAPDVKKKNQQASSGVGPPNLKPPTATT
jgi:hypothetical protein|tara:strand:+ start:93 stop:347 length:255 start_codon:yes stop_codon:yes gene_type:complete